MSNLYDKHAGYAPLSYASISNNEINPGSTDRVLPRQVSTGATRGTQNVGYGNVKIDGSNNRITIGGDNNSSVQLGSIQSTSNQSGVASSSVSAAQTGFGLVVTNGDGSTVGLGTIPNTTSEFGFFATDSDGTLIFKLVNGTIYMFDSTSSINTLQLGKLSNGTTNLVIAKPGTSVSTVLT